MALQFNEGSYGQAFQQGQQNLHADRDRNLLLIQQLGQLGQGFQTNKLAQAKALEDKKLYEIKLAEAQAKTKENEVNSMTNMELLSGNKISSPVTSYDMMEKLIPPSPMPSFGSQIDQMPQRPINQSFGEAALPEGQQMANQSMRPGLIEQFRNFQSGGKLRPQQMDIGEMRQVPGPSYNVLGPQPEPDISAQFAQLGLPPEAAYWTQDQTKKFGENKKLFADARGVKDPASLDALITKKVINGEITLDEALDMKKQSSGGSFMLGGIGGDGKPIFYNTKDPNKTVTGEVPGGGPLYPKTPSEGQMNAGLFGKRALEADQQLKRMIGSGLDPTSITTGGQEYLPNIMKGSGMQQFDQAKRNFINAVLRKESGAMISNQEMENANKQYFPQIGDQPEVIKQKDVNRQTAIQGLGTMAGPMGSAMRGPSQETQSSAWDQSKEQRYQELLRKRGGQ